MTSLDMNVRRTLAGFAGRIGAVLCLLAAQCTAASEATAPAGAGVAEGRARLQLIGERFAEGLEFRALGGASPAGASGTGVVDTALPEDATGVVRVGDVRSGVAIGFALEQTARVPGVPADGFVIYRASLPSGGDRLVRAGTMGAEDAVYYASAPPFETLRYRVDVSRVAGLRLVGDSLEFLDQGGTPRLRVNPPEVVDARGRHLGATLAVDGCAVDRSPRAPWGRAVTPPGASSCAVVVSWAGRGVRYPALVDPAWVSTSRMTVERAMAAVAALPDADRPGRVLITGGTDHNGSVLSSAELYEPLSRTFAATGPMSTPRCAHSATAIPRAAKGEVLIAGGAGAVVDAHPPERLAITSLGNSSSTEVYDPLTGTFTPGPPMSVPRFLHAATALADGRILLAGGIADAVNQPTRTADLFTWDPTAPPGSITPAGPMRSARSAHAAALLPSGEVLVTGGIGTATFALRSAEVFCPAAPCAEPTAGPDQFSLLSAPMAAARAYHTATVLPGGDVLLAGGLNAVSAPVSFSGDADLFDGAARGFLLQPIALAHRRAFHTATAFDRPELVADGSGRASAAVVLAGGYDGADDLKSVEAFVPDASSPRFVSLPDLSTPRRWAAAAPVSAGDALTAGQGVLVVGGVSGSTAGANGQAVRSAEVLVKPLGDACLLDSECLSGHCAAGVCCNVACTDECSSCLAVDQQNGVDGTCGPKKSGFPLEVSCFADAAAGEFLEVHQECDGTGTARLASGTRSCLPYACGEAGRCATGCDETHPCASGAYCDRSSTPGSCRTKSPLGAPCSAAGTCASGSCVDGVCCDSACGDGSTSDCQACSVAAGAASSGTCSPVAAGQDCRAAVDLCDAAERCDGSRMDCPPDSFLDPTSVCRPAASACDAPETCTGASARCPDDALQSDGASCDDGNRCTQTDRCRSGVCEGADPLTCAAPDACHVAGVCDPGTGACSCAVQLDGTPCPGGQCASGTCRQAPPATKPPAKGGCSSTAGAGAASPLLALGLLSVLGRRRRVR